MNTKLAFDLGLAPYSLVTLDGTGCAAGWYYDHQSANGSVVMSAGMRYHRPDGRIGVVSADPYSVS